MHSYLQIAALTVAAGLLLSACETTSGDSAPAERQRVNAWISSEFMPMDDRWYTDPWPESEIPLRLTEQPSLYWQPKGTAKGLTLIELEPEKPRQTIIGLGASLEHTTVYAIRKNKTPEQQREILKALIDPKQGIGMNLFRIEIGTSDFADGTRATPKPLYEKGWFSLQDSPEQPFSIERPKSLGIVETIQMALEVGEQSNNPIKLVASPWSPPDWMREGENMVRGGPLKADMLDRYAQYLRNFVEAYQAEGIPIYALTLQNERQFEPEAYPGMIISWQMERDLLIKVYENFHNISGHFGPELNVKLWTLDHNFDYWQQAKEQMDSFKAQGKAHYVDGTAFHHYGGDTAQMGQMHDAHPDKDVIFTEGAVWGLNADDNRRGFETVIRHFRNWSTAYTGWVTMITQQVDEANQGPYNKVGVLSPTLLVHRSGNTSGWYKTPEYWLMGQFSKFIRPGARRIESNYGSLETITNVAFSNPDGSYVTIVANSTHKAQSFVLTLGNREFTAQVPAKSIATYRW